MNETTPVRDARPELSAGPEVPASPLQRKGSEAARRGRFAVRTETAAHPSREQVARRAYELYLERGGGHGRDLEDWLRAEQELRSARASPRS